MVDIAYFSFFLTTLWRFRRSGKSVKTLFGRFERFERHLILGDLLELDLLPFYLASFEESPESYLAPSTGVFGVPGGRHDTRSLWGLYEMHETLWLCLVSGE